MVAVRRASATAFRDEDDIQPQWSRMSYDNGRQQTGLLSSPIIKYQQANQRNGDVLAPRTSKFSGQRAAILVLPLALAALALFSASSSPSSGLRLQSVKSKPITGTFAYATASPELEPYEVHPIHTLMKQAKQSWEAKLARQSKTYEEAVAEYRRRYKRDPPNGFQAWYDWAVAHDVQLIDEYDSLSRNVEPFFSLPPEELWSRIDILREHSLSHKFLTIRNGTSMGWKGAEWRDVVCNFFFEGIEEFIPLLPDLDIALFLHDGPMLFHDAEAMSGYLQAAQEGQWVDESKLPINGQTAWSARQRTCGPDSNFRRADMGLENQYQNSGPSFIRDHQDAMNYCKHPDTMSLHGSTAVSPWLSRLEPTFTLSKTFANGDWLWPAPIQYDLVPKNEVAFKDKPIHKIVWRGTPDGIWVEYGHDWRHSHRFRAIYLTNSNDTENLRLLRVTKKDSLGREYQTDIQASLAQLNERYTNVRPTNRAVQCDEPLCTYVEAMLPFSPKISLEEMAAHRYVLDVDGNAYSARFRTHLLSNQIPFKSTRYPEWYSDKIEPWLHYVPLKQDYSDLYNILAFFSGDMTPERDGHHDDLAEQIAVAGKDWAQRFWRQEDTKAYLFRLMLEYARVMDRTRDSRGRVRSEAGGEKVRRSQSFR
ncbi:hypothetical protein T439DRAFT_296122 [Meredithblackwellia eburnea MCA 4105]